MKFTKLTSLALVASLVSQTVLAASTEDAGKKLDKAMDHAGEAVSKTYDAAKTAADAGREAAEKNIGGIMRATDKASDYALGETRKAVKATEEWANEVSQNISVPAAEAKLMAVRSLINSLEAAEFIKDRSGDSKGGQVAALGTSGLVITLGELAILDLIVSARKSSILSSTKTVAIPAKEGVAASTKAVKRNIVRRTINFSARAGFMTIGIVTIAAIGETLYSTSMSLLMSESEYSNLKLNILKLEQQYASELAAAQK